MPFSILDLLKYQNLANGDLQELSVVFSLPDSIPIREVRPSGPRLSKCSKMNSISSEDKVYDVFEWLFR